MSNYRGKHSKGISPSSRICIILLLIAAIFVIFLISRSLHRSEQSQPIVDKSSRTDVVETEGVNDPAEEKESIDSAAYMNSDDDSPPDILPEVDTPDAPPSLEPFLPYSTDNTNPQNFILSTAIEVCGVLTEDYNSDNEISFSSPDSYSSLPGIVAFRGDNFRSGSSFGTADVNRNTIEIVWKQTVSSLLAPDGNSWTGTGWTGQPLIVTWPKSTRQIMNMYDWAKEQEELTEVIYAAEDGRIYFLELSTGRQTRDIVYAGFTFKGSGSLDPRGYPVLYVGAGYPSMKGDSRAFAYSLIDCSILFEFGNGDSFAERSWPCFDASPLVDTETDTLIWPGENGILYLVRLNSDYNESAGTLTMNPEYIKWRYRGARNTSSSFWLGMEDSPVIYGEYLFIADNGGYLMCLNLNTLQLCWVQDVLDDTNCSPVLSIENGHPYLYISTSYHYGWRSWSTADVPVFKIDAENGEIVWQKSYSCHSAEGISGGVQGTIAVGEGNLSEYIFVPVAKAESLEGGILVALRKDNGDTVWTVKTDTYSWGSPTIVYTKDGKGFLFLGTLYGNFLMIDGTNGKQLDSIYLQGHCESTAAAFDNMLVIGARSGFIFGIKLS